MPVFKKPSPPENYNSINIVTLGFPKVVLKGQLDYLIKHVQQQASAMVKANVFVPEHDPENMIPTPMMVTIDHGNLRGYSQFKVKKHVKKIMDTFRPQNGCTVAFPTIQTTLVNVPPSTPPPPIPGYLSEVAKRYAPMRPTNQVYPNLHQAPIGNYVDMTCGQYVNTTGCTKEEGLEASAPPIGPH